jgi:TatD DNase family protein
MQLHDTHFHLDLFDNPRQVIAAIEQAKVYTIAVTNLPELFDYTYDLTKNTKYIRAALGFHPELAAQHKQQLSLFKNKVVLTRYIGEVGLDNHNKTPANLLEQKKVFEKVVEASHESGNKILTVHSRRSERDVIAMIGPKFPGKIILHWYSGSLKDLEQAIAYGFYFSVNYAMTLSENGKKIIHTIPADRLLIETDGPFVKINNQISTPVYASAIYGNILNAKKDFKEGFLADNFRKLLLD